MPYSSTAGKAWIGSMLTAAGEVTRVLDVGTGMGHYSTLFRERYRDAEWVGVEIWGPYIERFQLEEKYDSLIVADIRWIDLPRLGHFDICFCGDVLEHMSIADAEQVVSRLLAFARLVFISVPLGYYPQGPVFNNPFERHIVDNHSDESMRRLFPAIMDGAIETVESWTIGTYALSSDPHTLAAHRARSALGSMTDQDGLAGNTSPSMQIQ